MKAILFSLVGLGAATAAYFMMQEQPKPRPQAPAVPKAAHSTVSAAPAAIVAAPIAKPVAAPAKPAVVAPAVATTDKPNVVLTPALPKVKTPPASTMRETATDYSTNTPAARPVEVATFNSAYRGAHIRFDNETINYGVITKGSNGKRKFRFTNDGAEPIRIASVLPGCHCVSADAPKQAIEPGKSGYIEVEYDTTIEGDFNKDFIVTSNSEGDDATKIIYVKGTVR
jgi:Protein of unknown function (DUF1573)